MASPSLLLRCRLALRRFRLARVFGMGLTMQALLSGANFIVGLILIRRTADLQYSYYILAANALLLITSLQTSFMQPYVVTRITRIDLSDRRELVGGVIRATRRLVPGLCAAAILLAVGLWTLHYLDDQQTLLIVASLLTAGVALGREFFRMTLFAYRRPFEVLRADLAYVVLLVAGAFVATLTPQPALFAIASLGVAALVGWWILRHGLWKFEPWNKDAPGGVLRKMAVMGSWAITGSGIHWLLIQGYSYLVAGLLDVRHVAALAATRLLLVPVFVLSNGVSMLLFPITSRWLHEKGVSAAVRRLSLLVAALFCLALCYISVMWFLRDWIFSVVLKKHFAQGDELLLLWSAVFLVTLCRDQLATLPASRERFRDMTLLTGASALVWVVASYVAVKLYGATGAVVGMLIGETTNVVGILFMIAWEMRRGGTALTSQQEPPAPGS
jgi:O-antigen/teichoic acid export membrane protein